MIIWLNGTFGAGKTTTAAELVHIVPKATIFDAEQVGLMLRHVQGLPRLGDFQHWPPWRGLVVQTATHLLDYLGGVLVIPQTVLIEKYWTEIRTGLDRAGIPLQHFLLHTDRDTLAHRIETDPIETGARQWRLEHLPQYQKALPWLRREAHVVDTSAVLPKQVAEVVATKAGAGDARTRSDS
ncbi:ATP-binding protein [Nonomuraea sp. NPDC050680]|uniref:ATP-binding protein n=1 Tax=Nonomuraea sp. NPDC050680 TaxID=3154630 RepID=UPI0033F7B96C